MKSNQSAGILLYRFMDGEVEILLVHPGGPYHADKDKGAWSIPKGEFDENEDALVAAKREFLEEIGIALNTENFTVLKPIRQKAGKIVYAWAAPGNIDVTEVKSNIFKMEYPYKSGKWIDVPEVDKAAWFKSEIAREKINPAQVAFIEQLLFFLKK